MVVTSSWRGRARLCLLALLSSLALVSSYALAERAGAARHAVRAARPAATAALKGRVAPIAWPVAWSPPPERQAFDGAAPVHAYAPLSSIWSLAAGALGAPTAAPVIMMLHGMCSEPLPTCDYWSEGARAHGWLVCPAGNGRCGQRPDWHGDGEEKARHLDAALDALRARHGAEVSVGNDILIGFSRGAFVARDVAYARPGRFRGLVLIGAALEPDPARLRASSIRRVVLASGDHDGARPVMIRAVAKLQQGGVEARFVSTGPIWHQLPADLATIVDDAIRWIEQAPDAPDGV
jgi:predicted esterase